MSKDTIYRQDAIEAICKVCSIVGDYTKCNGYPETSTWCDELVALRALPSAEPERKKGKWISLDDFRGKYNENGYKCSECGEHSDYEDNFCPNCGSQMER